MDALRPEIDRDGHGNFRDLCLIYGDAYREVFLEVILEWFVKNAARGELAALRKAVSRRAANIGKGGKRGRPRVEDDSDWLVTVKTETWQHIVEGRVWPEVAKAAGMKPTKANIRTLQRRQDQYAAMVWQACRSYSTVNLCYLDAERGYIVDVELLEKQLEEKRFQLWLWFRVRLPFGRFPQNDMSEGCKKIVIALAPRGLHADAQQLIRIVRRKRK